jgi:4-amino-4-deoxy-L-arabinose transferase-like glycosyltransferase
MTGSSARTRRCIVAAAAAGLALRLAFGLLYWIDKPLTHDEREYLGLARSLAEGRGFVHDESIDVGTGQRFGRAPVYPLFLAAVGAGHTVGGHAAPAADEAGGGEVSGAAGVPTRVKIAQAVVGALTVYLIALIAWRAAGPRAAVAAAWLAAVYPPLVWIHAYALSESLYSAFALLTAMVVQRAFDAGSPHAPHAADRLALAAGALTGLSILIRPAMLFFVPLALAWFAWRGRPRSTVLLLAATVAVLAPWTVRNAIVYDRFILVASEGGVTFWTGNHPLAVGEGDLAANPRLKLAELEFRRAHAGLTPEELEPLYYRDALASIAADPVWWLGLLVRKAFYTVVPVGPSYTLHSTRYWAASVFPYAMLLPIALVGCRRLWRSERRPMAVLLLGMSAVLSGLVFFPQERFRIPVIDPLIIIAAAAAVAAWRQRARTARPAVGAAR